MAGYSAISSYSRVEIMHLIQQRGQRTVSELADATGLHANTVREHLQRLIDAGHVGTEVERRATRGRPRVLYSAATATRPNPIVRDRAQAAARLGDIMRRVLPDTATETAPTADPVARAEVHQWDALVDDAQRAGFDPVADEADLTLDLSPCRQVAAHPESRETLCAVHLGLMQDVLDAAGGPLRIDGVQRTCDPAQCVVQLRRTDDL